MESELLPCPFCGGEAGIGNSQIIGYFVNCIECLASTDQLSLYDYSKEEAIEKWNTRANKAALIIAGLKHFLESENKIAKIKGEEYKAVVLADQILNKIKELQDAAN